MTILVVYSATRSPLRTAVNDHLHSFERYSGARCIHVNVAVRRLPRALRRIPIDLVIYHTTLLDARWSRRWFRRLMERTAQLDELPVPKVALPQDEYISTDLLNEFLRARGVGNVFSCAQPSEWTKIYPGLAERGVHLSTVLTGYLTDHTLATIRRLEAGAPPRDLDISYRAWQAPAWLGRHGNLKTAIAPLVQARAAAAGLSADISTRREDTLYGDDWFRMLLRSRWVIGVEGGASLLDRDASIRTRTEAYVRRHPGASFEEVEAACFPGADGNLDYSAISPRHLEACATRTGQILVEGTFNGVLQSGRHYLALKRDLSNVDEVLDQARDEGLRREMVETAYRDVVQSGRYDYRGFVDEVMGRVMGDRSVRAAGADASALRRMAYAQLRLSDRLSWPRVHVLRGGIDTVRGVLDRVRGGRPA